MRSSVTRRINVCFIARREGWISLSIRRRKIKLSIELLTQSFFSAILGTAGLSIDLYAQCTGSALLADPVPKAKTVVKTPIKAIEMLWNRNVMLSM